MSCCDLHAHAERKPDPTKTVGIQKQFEGEAYRRFRWLKGKINDAIVKEDGFGLKNSANGLMLNRGQFEFARTSDKVSAFMDWLNAQEAAGVLGVAQGVPARSAAENAWTTTYIESAYGRGVSQAASNLRAGGARVEQSWLDTAFMREIHADRAGLAYTRTFTELEGITRAMDQQIARELALGLAEGQSPVEIARRLNNRVDKIGTTRARMLARTEVVAAHADATLNSYVEAGIEGVDVEAEWLTAENPCPICEDLQAKSPYSINDARGLIPAHPNCLPGNSLVLSRAGISAASKRWFDGDMFIIKTASGRVIECTPNHPVLSDSGWIPAKLFNVGDKVICDAGSEWVASGGGDDQNIPTAIHDIFESLTGSSDVPAVPVPLSSEDFHGDASDGEIAVIWSDVLLNGVSSAFGIKPASKKPFKVAIKSCAKKFGLRCKAFFFKCSNSTLGGIVSRFCVGDVFGLCSAGHHESIGISPPSSFDSSVIEPPIYSSSGDAELARKLINGESCSVFTDDVVSVQRYNYSGHVYNLDTGEGWYSANGIITHNCRCAWAPMVINGTGIALV